MHIISHRHLVHRLEIHVILLTLTHLRSRMIKELQHFSQHLFRCLGDTPVTVDAHHIARQNRTILSPFGPDRRITPAERRLVHDIVVDQCKCMEDFQSCRRLKNLIIQIIPEKRICDKAQPRSQPFSTTINHISQRVIQSGRFLRKTDFREQFADTLIYLNFADHISISFFVNASFSCLS